MEILNFELKDLQKIKEIERECFPEIEAFSDDFILFLWRKFPKGFLVAKEKNEVLGYGICQIEKGKGLIFSIAVKKKWQNLGIGKKILEKLIEVLRDQGIKKIFLHVREKNLKAISFYQKFGFEIKEKVENYYSNGENAFLMEKTL